MGRGWGRSLKCNPGRGRAARATRLQKWVRVWFLRSTVLMHQYSCGNHVARLRPILPAARRLGDKGAMIDPVQNVANLGANAFARTGFAGPVRLMEREQARALARYLDGTR